MCAFFLIFNRFWVTEAFWGIWIRLHMFAKILLYNNVVLILKIAQVEQQQHMGTKTYHGFNT